MTLAPIPPLRALPALALLALPACTTVSNLLIPPHPRSLVRDADLRVTLETEPDCRLRAAPERRPAVVEAALAGIAVAAAERLLREEAEQYRASYSAVGHHRLVDRGRLASCLRFVRARELPPQAAGREPRREIENPLVELAASLERDGPALRVGRADLLVGAVASKVAALSNPFPPSWPLLGRGGHAELSTPERLRNALAWLYPWMWLHGLWGLADSDLYEVELTLRLRIDAVLDARPPRLLTVAELEFPFGRFDVRGPARAVRSESGYVPLPHPKVVPANVAVTVVEANDLGDLLGRGAGLVRERRGDLRERLGDALGW
jgi:hypothetical protein